MNKLEENNKMFEILKSSFENALSTNIHITKFMTSYTFDFCKRDFLTLNEIIFISSQLLYFNLRMEKIGYTKIENCIFIIFNEVK